MNRLHDTWLWKAAFVESRPEVNPHEQAFFKLHLEAMREKVQPLVARIMADMPGYTVHDVTHLDALWETASLVAPPSLALNPPEAFVFGGAVLLHDAAMTLAAYPGGLAELKKTVTWADAAALAGLAPSGPGAAPSDPSPELEERIKVDVLRRLHAEKAAELAVQGWPTAEGDRIYLIEESELRRFYGPRIGTIAHSHWWPISKVERELDSSLGPLAPRTTSSVDLLKVACLLRVADALHLDRRRAPRFMRALEKPQGLSALHWTFQEKLAFPQRKDDAVLFTAGEPFGVKDADAWWQAFDAFAMADRELRDTDRLLIERGRHGLAVRRVKGADSPAEMARHIQVSGWRPVETRIRISDIPRIVETLGGEKLYGTDMTAPVRELLQNAMDAIQARRRLQDRSEWGQIVVALSEREDGFWLSVEDNGIGMSESVLTGALLDFGTSFWRSAQVAEELPGLASKGMEAIGRFGIGFFSVFMLGEHVRVITRRYDRGESEALILEFRSGLGSRPILLLAPPKVAPLDGGTRVEVRLSGDPRHKSGLLLSRRGKEIPSTTPLGVFIVEFPIVFSSLAQLVGYLAPSSEVSIAAVEFGRRTPVVAANDWLSLPPSDLLQRSSLKPDIFNMATKTAAGLMREIKTADGMIYGRATVYPRSHHGMLTAGGLRIGNGNHFLGILKGTVTTAARHTGKIGAPPAALSAWAAEQAKLIAASKLHPEIKALAADCILECGGSIDSLPIVCLGYDWLNSAELRKWVLDNHEFALRVGDVDYNEQWDSKVSETQFNELFELIDTIFIVPLKSGDWGRGPDLHRPEERKSYLRPFILDILKEAWGGFEEREEWQTVGWVEGVKIERLIELYCRPGTKAKS